MSQLPFEALRNAVYGPAFEQLVSAGVDLGTYQSWDPDLSRRKRILVPIDVQGYVSPTHGAESIVPIGTLPDDPDPFAVGQALPAGVHLHWAMPDALVRGRQDPTAGKLLLPDLPDRWVVVRTLLPEGGTRVIVTGWVIDAVHGVTAPLGSYSGTFVTEGTEALVPLNGASRSTMLWSATYEAARGRFTLHDPLDDLASLDAQAPHGFHGGRAVYTVSGWWSDDGKDPLAQGGARLADRLASLDWSLSKEAAAEVASAPDPMEERLAKRKGARSPEPGPAVTIVTEHGESTMPSRSIAQMAKMPVEHVSESIIGLALPAYLTLLHGSVIGVPISGEAAGTDDRPNAADVGAAMGFDVDDVAAAFAGPRLGLDAAHRQTAERLVSAFTSNLLPRIGTADGLSDLEGREHADGFWGLKGASVPGAHPDVLRREDTTPYGPTSVGRKMRGGRATRVKPDVTEVDDVRMEWKAGVVGLEHASSDSEQQRHRDAREREEQAASVADPSATRQVDRPAPRIFRPAPVLIGLRGVRPSLRHHGDGLFEDGQLRVRLPDEALARISGVVEGSTLLPTLGNGAIPPEVITVVREAVLYDGYSWRWIAAAGLHPGSDEAQAKTRVSAEMMRVFGTSATYDASGSVPIAQALHASGAQAASNDPWDSYSQEKAHAASRIAVEMARWSLADGIPPSPVAITTWRQPWIPLFLEWQVRLDGSSSMEGWSLDGLDLEATEPGADQHRTLTGRSPLTAGVGKALTAAMSEWIHAEQERDNSNASQLDAADQNALGRLADLIRPLDLASASLDGINEMLMGLTYRAGVQRVTAPDGTMKPEASALPTPLFGGTLTVEGLRLVDAFGRTLELPTEKVATTLPLEVEGNDTGLRLRPRIQPGARWLARLVDPGYPATADPSLAPEAYVDQTHAPSAISPVAGFLLPDHIDEALEVFDRDGNPLGQVMHDAVTEAVTWEPAPGRPLPPDAGPLAGIPAHAQHAAFIATGLIQADIDGRHGADPPAFSTLSALLRAVDSTLWGIDTFAAIGSPTIAGLVGRPIAVVRLNVSLDVAPDIDDVVVTEAGGPAARTNALSAIAQQQFPFRIGEIARSDDSVLGFFVDDDYSQFHIVDKVVRDAALSSGPRTGYLGLLGDAPVEAPIDHAFLVAEDTLTIQPGQVRRLTVLMLPAGKLHLTSGILPRKALSLADDWVTPGLSKVVPSMRVGPLLVDPDEIRLPNVASMGSHQVFTRRTGTLTWRDDPILASTTNAYLPKMPHEVQEGWIRIAPPDTTDGTTTGGRP